MAQGAGLVTPRRILETFTVRNPDLDTENFILHLSDILNLIPNLSRFILAAIFIGSFFLQPLKRPIMTIWERIIDSEKPFTLLFAGGATIGTIIHTLL